MENNNTMNNEEIEIDLWEVFHLLLSKAWIIILAGITAGLLFLAGTLLFITPQYESTTKMYVLNKQDNSTLTSSDMQTSLYLTKDYAELIQSRTVMEGVIAQLNLDMDDQELLKKITVENETDTRVIAIKVRDEDPYVACQIADAVRDVAADHIQKVMDTEAVNIVETANIPTEKASPSLTKNTVIGGVLGLVIAIAAVLIAYLTNDTIKTQEDVEKYLGLSTLGTIPLMENAGKGRNSRKNKKSRKKSKRRG